MTQTVILLYLLNDKKGITHRKGILQVKKGDKGAFPDQLAYSLIKENLAEEIGVTRGRPPKENTSKQAKKEDQTEKEEKAEKNEEDSL